MAALEVPKKEAAALKAKVSAQEQQIAAMQKQIATRAAAVDKRFSELADYDIKEELTIYFDVNSTKLSDKAKKDLETLAARAKTFKGYLIQVAGYTDSDGSAGANQALSDRRAGSVVNYLRQSCDIGLSRVLSAVAMSEAKAVSSNETAQGKAENRRVTVKLGVNRGISPP
ncbi:MAG: OmpA family protein [Betaproteobacteria bacterium]